MILYDLSFKTPLENLMCDEMLLQRAEKDCCSDDVLRLWESPVSFVVLGMAGKVEEDVNINICRRDNIEILRRSSGGGTVLQGPGCLNFSFICSKEKNVKLKDLHRSYREILDPIVDMLRRLHVDAEFFPVSDLALKNTCKKISGNAQRRLHNHILHHGTILYDFDISCVGRYLKFPKKIPEYRADRSHQDFIANVDLDRQKFYDGFCRYFQPSKIIHQLNENEKVFLSQMIDQGRPRYII